MVLNFSEAAAQAVQGAACSLLALSDEATSWINNAIGANGDFANVARALRKNVCNESDPTGDYGGDVPFEGGQCDTNYDVRCDGFRFFPGGSVRMPFLPRTVRIPGPIGGIVTRASTGGNPLNTDWGIQGANGFNYFSTSQDSDTDATFEILSITRPDGQPDDCGDPPGTIAEYNDYSETVSITYEDNSETEITEDIDITLGPLIIGIGGILYAPVTIGTGDIDINGQIVLAPELSVDLWPDGLFGGGGNTDNPAPDPSEPDPEPTVPDERRRIIGAIVTVTNFDEDIARVTQVAQGDSPDIFVPRTGNVSFYIDTPGGQAWTEPTPLRNVRQYVPCPAREGAVDVAVTEGTGFTLAVTPVYADLAVI